MAGRIRVAAAAIALAVVAVNAPVSRAQQGEFTNNFRFNRGQAIQPIFEGWSWAADGSINMHFGYLNRNYAEEPQIPVGPNNRIEPGGPDRGQPTFFYSRTRRNLFLVNVPKTWGKRDEVVWTVTHHDVTERAVGWLQAEWEIDPSGGSTGAGNTPERAANKTPTITVTALAPATVATPVTLAASVADDGLPVPKPKGKPAVGQETPPTLVGGTDAPVNVPTAAPREEARPGARPDGLVVTWMVWRGPADVAFAPRFTQDTAGQMRTTATFRAAGDYVLRATADDGAATRYVHVPIKVTAASGSGQ